MVTALRLNFHCLHNIYYLRIKLNFFNITDIEIANFRITICKVKNYALLDENYI